ncbi:MAG: FitA-like ribbon-helix-helix domain-containing protein [Spirochaetota bacterium]
MANITVRNIPDEILEKIKKLSSIEKRSLNKELLVIIEKGTHWEITEMHTSKKTIPKSIQVHLWKNLSEKWDDERSTDEIIKDIYNGRTYGREISL